MAITPAALSTYLQDGLIDRLFHSSPSFTQPVEANIQIALFSDQPTDSGGTELTYTGYARENIDFNVASVRDLTQNGLITFGQNTGGDQTAQGYGIFEGANMLAYGDINPDKLISTNNTPSIADSSIVLTFTAGNVSDYLARVFLDYAFNDGATDPSSLAIYGWLSTSEFTSTGNGSSLSEPSDTYGRILHNTWNVTANAVTNNGSIDFATPGASWGVITAVGIATAISAGEVLFYDNSPTGDGQTPTSGDTVAIPDTTFAASLD
jgi:hypothetical protein